MHTHEDLNMRIFSMFDAKFSLDVGRIISLVTYISNAFSMFG